MRQLGSSSPTRDRTWGPLHWEQRVITTGPPGRSLDYAFCSQDAYKGAEDSLISGGGGLRALNNLGSLLSLAAPGTVLGRCFVE